MRTARTETEEDMSMSADQLGVTDGHGVSIDTFVLRDGGCTPSRRIHSHSSEPTSSAPATRRRWPLEESDRVTAVRRLLDAVKGRGLETVLDDSWTTRSIPTRTPAPRPASALRLQEGVAYNPARRSS